MLFTTLVTTLLSSLPTTNSAPAATKDSNYQCGYVLTKQNSSSYAGLSAFDECTPFYYNQTIGDYQDAYAYRLWGGCQCSFFVNEEACARDVEAQRVWGPTEKGEDPWFAEPKPKWYDCFQTD